jgi:ubiquinone/menaquinone biosynthesis C-methylase UbiE
MSKKINLGCGDKKIDGFIGVDKIKTSAVDIVHDLNIFPYPFKEDSVDEVLMDNSLEHLDDTLKVMEEIYRICRDGAMVRINVPYYKSSGAFSDPTHKNFFTESSFRCFSGDDEYSYYSKARFKVIKNKPIILKELNDFKHKLRNILPFKKVLNNFLFNIYDEIEFVLKCVK